MEIHSENIENAPAISIIMSVKNGGSFLEKSIESILNQTFTDWEFIICDDGSTDKTLEILKSHQTIDSRFVIIRNEVSRGLAYSLNKCIQISRSNIIARQDADDTSCPQRLEHQFEFVINNPQFAIVGTNWNNIMPNGDIIPKMVPEHLDAISQYKGGLFMHPSWMMRKDQIEKVGFYTANKYTKRSQDYHLMMKILGFGLKACNLQENLYNYTVDEGTINRSMNWKNVKGLMWIRWDAYKRNKLPLHCYFYVFKPIISNLIPKFLMRRYYKSTYRN